MAVVKELLRQGASCELVDNEGWCTYRIGHSTVSGPNSAKHFYYQCY